MRTKILFLGVLSLLLANCTRSSKEITTVTIQLPQIAQSKVTAMDASSDDNNPDDDDDGWLADIPTHVGTSASGNKGINCYMIAVEGPEAVMRYNSCGKKDENNDYTPSFHFGTWAGLEQSGGTLKVEVPAGPDRVFRLLGIYARTPAECRDWSQGAINRQELSKPYILATATRSLVGGVDARIDMPMVLNLAESVDDCRFFNRDIYNEGVQAATKVVFKKESFPEKGFVVGSGGGPSTCEAVDFALRNDSQQGATRTVPVEVELRLNSNQTDTYELRSQCMGNTGNVGRFLIQENTKEARRWVRTNGLTPGANLVVAAVVTDDIVSSDLSLVDTRSETGAQSFEITGPKFGIIGKCYEYVLRVRDNSWSPYTLTTPFVSTITAPGGVASQIYEDSDCEDAISTLFVSGGKRSIFLKFQGASGMPQILNISNGSSPSDARMTFVPTEGLSTPKRLKILGSDQINVGRCYPIYLSLENEYGAAVHNGASARTVNFTIPATPPFNLYADANCSNGQELPSPVSIAAFAQWAPFYIKGDSFVLGTSYIDFIEPASGIKDRYKFTLDED